MWTAMILKYKRYSANLIVRKARAGAYRIDTREVTGKESHAL